MQVAKLVKFHGLVQGVNFRRQTERAASREHVNGWVRNLPDGSVEALFSGEQNAVFNLLQFCLHDVSGADVESYEIQDSETSTKNGFEIH